MVLLPGAPARLQRDAWFLLVIKAHLVEAQTLYLALAGVSTLRQRATQTVAQSRQAA